jgi:hypothetical protein
MRQSYRFQHGDSAAIIVASHGYNQISRQNYLPSRGMNAEAKFKGGDYVQRVNQPELAGIVRELRWDAQVESWNYLVQFGAQLRAVPEEALEPVTVVQSPWESFEQGSLSGKTHFVFTLTYERLKSPPARIAHSFATARTQFYPYQFKPLLKFLDNPGKSVLPEAGVSATVSRRLRP